MKLKTKPKAAVQVGDAPASVPPTDQLCITFDSRDKGGMVVTPVRDANGAYINRIFIGVHEVIAVKGKHVGAKVSRRRGIEVVVKNDGSITIQGVPDALIVEPHYTNQIRVSLK